MTIVDLLRPSARVLTASRRTVIMPADLPTLQRSPMPRQRLSSTGFMEYPASEAASLRLDAGEFDHLGPLFGFVGNQLAEVSRRSRQRHAAEVSETGLHLRVVESRVDLLVELLDDLGRRVPRNADAIPRCRLVARHEFSHSGDIR